MVIPAGANRAGRFRTGNAQEAVFGVRAEKAESRQRFKQEILPMFPAGKNGEAEEKKIL